MHKKIEIEPQWREVLKDYLETPAFNATAQFVREQYLSATIYPKPQDVFRAFWLTPFSEVKIVILGQDPYHGPGQAHGLCFSVQSGITPPPSLQNIYKEIESNLGIKKDMSDGNLEPWAKQGVFLLNSILTVVAKSPASHKAKGWEEFTDHIIGMLSEKKDRLVFMLWGNYARGKRILIDESKHLILEAPHPSPFSAHSGFFGCKHFSQSNQFLIKHNLKPIVW